MTLKVKHVVTLLMVNLQALLKAVSAAISAPESSLRSQDTNAPVGAVVQTSALVVIPDKLDPNTPEAYRFFTNKLDPLTPRHEFYMGLFIKNLSDPARKDWQAFRKKIEADPDPDSPWRSVLVKISQGDDQKVVTVAGTSTNGVEFPVSALFVR